MITPELLLKYAQDDCTVAERAAVEQWLAAENDHFCNTHISPADEMVKAQIWDNVYASTIGRVRSFQQNVNLIRNICFPVAAMLLIIAGLNISERNIDSDKHVVIDNLAGKRAIVKTFGDLTYLVEPGSRCELVISGKNNESDLKFCGAVSVANHSGENSELRIKTGLLTCTNKFSDELTVRNGQTYLAMTDDQYNVIAATTDELKEGIPGPFSAKLHQRFSL
jgi:hypothetical protein